MHATAGVFPHASRIDPIFSSSGVRKVLFLYSGMSSHRRQKVEIRCDGRSGVLIFLHAISAGHFCSGHFKPNSCTSFNFNQNVGQNFLYTRVKSVVCILLEPVASRKWLATNFCHVWSTQWLEAKTNFTAMLLVGCRVGPFRSCWESLE